MQFKIWLENQLRISPDDNGQNLYLNDKEIGSVRIGIPGDDNNVAMRMFPGTVKPGEKVARIQGINIDDDMRGFGLGQWLYLRAFDKSGADWHYNSQCEPPATNALKALAAKGYIELYWKPFEPEWNQEGQLHIVKITPKGQMAYRSGEIVNKKKLKINIKRI